MAVKTLTKLNELYYQENDLYYSLYFKSIEDCDWVVLYKLQKLDPTLSWTWGRKRLKAVKD